MLQRGSLICSEKGSRPYLYFVYVRRYDKVSSTVKSRLVFEARDCDGCRLTLRLLVRGVLFSGLGLNRAKREETTKW